MCTLMLACLCEKRREKSVVQSSDIGLPTSCFLNGAMFSCFRGEVAEQEKGVPM